MTAPVKVAVTGAAGQIGYALVYRIASGELFPGRQVELRLLEVPQAVKAVEGVAMELVDCAFPTLAGIEVGDDPDAVFDGANAALLVGSMPRRAGMERADLLAANGQIFSVQGRALNAAARRTVKVLVVGNPVNTNALITRANAPDLPPENFAAMTRLDHNRAVSQLAARTGRRIREVEGVIIWGNHSTTQYPDIRHATIGGQPALELVGHAWYEQTFIGTIQHRGAEVIRVRGKSSAASGANAALEHMRDWVFGLPAGRWTSMAVCSDGSYGIEPGLMFSYPVEIREGRWRIVQGLTIDDFSRERIRASEGEILRERDMVRHLLP